jgi:hypothetical protein
MNKDIESVELYYHEPSDCVQMVENGVLKYHDEGINSCDFLCSFGENVNTVEDLKNVAIENILEGYKGIITDFKYHSSEGEVKDYFEDVAKETIKGELIFSWKKE